MNEAREALEAGAPPMQDAASDGESRIVVGLSASPGPATELARTVRRALAEQLTEDLPGATWQVEVVTTRLGTPPLALSELIDAARRRLIDEGWHLAVCVTDLPLQTS